MVKRLNTNGGLSGGSMSGMAQGRAFHPAFGTDVNYRFDPLPQDPDAQVAATIALMQRYALEDASSRDVVRAVRAACQGVDDSDPWTPVERVFWWVKRRVRFVQDEATAGVFNPAARAAAMGEARTVEVLIRPVDLLAMGPAAQGDCDDFSMLTAAMLVAAGYQPVFTTVAADGRFPDQFSHVYVVLVPVEGVRLGVDTSHGPAAGWECPNLYGKRQDWPLYGGGYGQGLEACVLLAAGVAGYLLGK